MANKKDYQRVRSSNESARGQDDIEMERMARPGQSNGAKRQNGASRGLMYDVDEEGRRLSSDSIRPSEEMKDREMLSEMQRTNSKRPSLLWRFTKYALISFALLILFILLGGGAYKASGKNFEDLPYAENLPIFNHDTIEEVAGATSYKPGYLSNGSSLYAPTTILISLDGFRPDYLTRGVTPGLNTLIRNGASAEFMKPSFPSVTFPNHYTMMTGLHPESHGIVGNSFYDPTLEEEFYYTNPEHSMQAKWWSAEPLWVTAEDQGVRTAIHMWPGSEANIPDVEPTYLDHYNKSELLGHKANRIFELLVQRPGPQEIEADPSLADGPQRPQFIAAYIPEVDSIGHQYGPDSPEMLETIGHVDLFIRTVDFQLTKFGLDKVVNFIVVSDHGMAPTSTDRLVQLEDLIDPELIATTEGWPNYGIRLRDPSPEHLETVYNRLEQQTALKDGFNVYLRDRNMPERFHFTNNERIAPLWIMPKAGWAIVTKTELDVSEAQANNDIFHPLGIHGYDNDELDMRAIFIARGPAFPRGRVDAFQNIEVYNLVCDSLGIEPRPNNGTLRLPLKVDESVPDIIPGKFNPEDEDNDGNLQFPDDKNDPDANVQPTHSDAADAPAPEPTPAAPVSDSPTSDLDDEFTDNPIDAETKAEIEEEFAQEEAEAEGMDEEDWKEWFGDEFEGFKGWVDNLFGGGKGGAPSGGEELGLGLGDGAGEFDKVAEFDGNAGWEMGVRPGDVGIGA